MYKRQQSIVRFERIMSGLMVNSHEGRKPSSSWTRPPGRPRRTWLNLVQEDANAIHLYGELRSSGVMGRRNGPSGLRDDDSLRQANVNNTYY